ncbi:MAG: YtxH domain-containing protein [Bacteroidota bacterium]
MNNEAKGIRKGLLIGVLAGAALGSVVALLYAPKSGKKLREDIKTKSNDFIEDTEKYYSKAKKKFNRLFDGIKKKSETLISDNYEKVEKHIQSDKTKIEKEAGHIISALKTEKHSQ